MATIPRAARCRHCCSNCAGEPLVQPPPKKNTMAGRFVFGPAAGSKIHSDSRVSPAVL
jgi:hypothetical protein